MWQPEPGWHALPGGTGTSTVGVWRAVLGDRPVAVKRLAAPAEHDPAELSDPRHFAYWRRAADVVTSGIVAATPGLRCAARRVGRGGRRRHHPRRGLGRGRRQQRPVRRARHRPVRRRRPRRRPVAGPRPAARPDGAGRAPGRLDDAGPDHGRRRRRPPVAAPRRSSSTQLDALTQVPQHGDPVPANLPGREGDEVVAIDWAMLGTVRSAPTSATTCSRRARSSSRCSTPT